MKRVIYLIGILFLVGFSAVAQDSSTKKADKYYDRLKYVDAIKEYRKLVKKKKGGTYVYKQLAKSYHNVGDNKNAEKYYRLYMKKAKDVNAEDNYTYASVLLENEDYDEAMKYLQLFAEENPEDVRAKAFMRNPDYITEILTGEPRFEVDKSPVSSRFIDFGGFEKDGKLYFVSSRNESRRNYGWNNQPTLDVYVATKENGIYKNASLLEGEVNTKFNEGTVVITPDGKTMYFTRNDYTDGNYGSDTNGIGRLKIYSAKNVNGKWDDIQELPFNSSEYTTAHPSLSPDGKTLYFCSDMPGGKGDSDIYKVSINEDGSFGTPINMVEVNTEGKESFPFVDENGVFYFSSNGHLGLGGLDVFMLNEKGEVVNMGRPINSNKDDFAFTFDATTKQGLVSSNREGKKKGNVIATDNIYGVAEIIPDKFINLSVKVIDIETGHSVDNATVAIYKDNSVVENGSGSLTHFDLLAGSNYQIQVNAEGYHSNSKPITKDVEGEFNVVVEMEPVQKIIQAEEIVLNPIYYEYNSAEVTPQAALELDKLVGVMSKYPEIAIEIESHTDTRGSADYNRSLSQRRAENVVAYVIGKGIDASRISGKGMGEDAPKVNCGDNCTEEQHAQNLRSVFKILKNK